MERTLLSAYNFLQGLYPATDPHAVEIFTIDNDVDNGWPNTVMCPALTRVYEQVKQSDNFTSFYNQNIAPLAVQWGSAWGMKLKVDDMRGLNDILRARFCHSLALPPSVQLADAQKLMLGVRVLDNMLAQPFASRKFGSGSFLADLLAALNSSARFSLFSAHDDTCRALLFSLYLGENDFSVWPACKSHFRCHCNFFKSLCRCFARHAGAVARRQQRKPVCRTAVQWPGPADASPVHRRLLPARGLYNAGAQLRRHCCRVPVKRHRFGHLRRTHTGSPSSSNPLQNRNRSTQGMCAEPYTTAHDSPFSMNRFSPRTSNTLRPCTSSV